ncbi:MAG: hypothetical protein Q9191_004736, partial [Dirinaria sp. TL-2023a]
MDTSSFYATFKEALASDTERVKVATVKLKRDFYPFPDSLLILIELLVSDEEASLRQLAATQAKNLVPKHWNSVPQSQKPQIRGRLLQRTLFEQEKLVRHGASRVIAAIAKIDFENTEWQDLIDTLLQAGVSESPQAREVSTHILCSTIESAGETMLHQMKKILPLFATTINDPESQVRANTMVALGHIAVILSPDNDEETLHALQDSIPHMVRVIKAAIDIDDEDRVLQAFEVFQTLLSCDAQVLNKYFQDLVHFMIQVAAEKALDEDYRTQAISFLMAAVHLRPLKILGLKLGEEITVKCLEIATELGEDPDDDDDEINPSRSALGLLTILAEKLPPSQVVVPLLNAMGAYVNSDNTDRRRAGILALAMCVEGAPGFVTTQLSEIIPLIVRLLADNHPRVRRAALDCLIKMGEDLSEDLAKQHQELTPALVKTMDRAVHGLTTPSDEVNIGIIKASCNALGTVAEGMEEDDLKNLLKEVYPRMSRLFSHPDLKIKAAAIEAIGSIAGAAEDAFVPYFEHTMKVWSDYVRIKGSDDELDLRCTTCDAMGFIALAVGPEPFQPYVRPMMEATGEAMHLDHPKLKETSFLFWGNMAKNYGAEFKPFLDGALKCLFESLEAEESELEVDLGANAADLAGKEVIIGGKKIKVAEMSDEEINGGSDIEDVDVAELDDDDEDWDDELQAVTAVAQEKEIAVEVLGDMMSHLTNEFTPYLDKALKIVLPLVEHHYEGVRRAATGTLFRLYNSCWELQPDEFKEWSPGLPLQSRPTDEVIALGEMIMKAVLASWPEDDEPSSVTETSRFLGATLKVAGPCIVAPTSTLKTVTETLVEMLTHKHPCQLSGEASDDEDDEATGTESAEYEYVMLDTALEAVIGLATALGPTFIKLWDMFEKPIMKYASSSDHVERSTAVGVIAEVVRETGESITPCTTTLLKLLLHRLSDEDHETKANAAYGIGLLQEKSKSKPEITKAFPTILAKLEPLLRTDNARAVDNAAGCVSRMIMSHQEHVPINAVVPALVNLLPLKEDFQENEPVWFMLSDLYAKEEPVVLAHMPQIIAALEHLFTHSKAEMNPPTTDRLMEMLTFIFRDDRCKGEIFQHDFLSELYR